MGYSSSSTIAFFIIALCLNEASSASSPGFLIGTGFDFDAPLSIAEILFRVLLLAVACIVVEGVWYKEARQFSKVFVTIRAGIRGDTLLSRSAHTRRFTPRSSTFTDYRTVKSFGERIMTDKTVPIFWILMPSFFDVGFLLYFSTKLTTWNQRSTPLSHAVPVMNSDGSLHLPNPRTDASVAFSREAAF